MTPAATVLSSVSTHDVDPVDRLAFWERHNAEALVGLTCSTYAEEGLVARELNLGLSGFRVADIEGNAHVIERAPTLVRSIPKDAVFVSVCLQGDAFFYHSTGCTALVPGDVIVYPTDRPYLFGFTSSMRQVLVDVPVELFRERCAAPPTQPLKVDGHGRGMPGASARALAQVLTALVDDPVVASVGVGDHLLDLLGTMTEGHTAAPNAVARLLAAKDHIERRLGDPTLCTDSVARALGVTSRHLNRAFAAEGTSVAQYIQARRLDAARRELSDPTLRHRRIADVAFRWGFASQAHFTRLFRARYGCTPGAARPGCDLPPS